MDKTKIISVDFKASFGFLKKYDTNEGIYLTYNCIHKPALLGIFGAILGLGGYYQAYIKRRQIPDYFEKLKDIKIGIEPLNSVNGNFSKTIIKYNNSVGYANKDGGILNVQEQTLIAPSYRVYILLNENEYSISLYEMLKNREAIYIPYLGKNEYQLIWEEPKEYNFSLFEPTSSFSINSIFRKNDIIKNHIDNVNLFNFDFLEEKQNTFFYFERLPIGFSNITNNYELEEFVYTNALFSPTIKIFDLYEIIDEFDNKIIIYLF